MKAIKTKSGKWRCRPVDHYEIDENGKMRAVQVCITRDTKKEALHAAYAYERERELKPALTFAAALDKYIKLRQAVLSPSTVRAYKSLQKTAFVAIDNVPLRDINSEILQAWISDFSVTHSAKSTANVHALASAVLKMFRPDKRFSVQLPQRETPVMYTPTDADVKALLSSISGTDLERAVLLASLGTLRRSEICALYFDDIIGNSVNITKAMVMTPLREWIIKAPKTPSSVRSVQLPASAIEIIVRDRKAGDRIVSYRPDLLTKDFQKAREAVGLPYFRLHDLRAYSASIRHALGVPDQYIMAAGGWKNDYVLKQIYRRTMADKTDEFSSVVNDHFSEMLAK